MPLAIEVRLIERLPDRARVLVTVTPREDVVVDGLSVELFTDDCDSIGHRVELPVPATLSSPLVARAELRGDGALPPRAVVVASVWRDGVETRAWCPADPWTAFEAHVRGRRSLEVRAIPEDERILEGLVRGERRALERMLPWVVTKATCTGACGDRTGPLDVPEGGGCCRDVVDEMTDELGLNASDAAFLREILDAEDV